MAAFDRDGNLIDGTEGNVVKIEQKYTYYGDGDGSYWLRAVVATEDGYVYMQIGESNWGYGDADPKGSEVDAPQRVIDNYSVWLQAKEDERQKQHFNTYGAYELKKGALGFVEKGTRRRKNAGRWGHVIWIGYDSYGNTKCGLKNPETEEVTWVAAYQVVIVPDFDDFEQAEDLTQAA